MPAEGVGESLGTVYLQQQSQHVFHGCNDNINTDVNIRKAIEV